MKLWNVLRITEDSREIILFGVTLAQARDEVRKQREVYGIGVHVTFSPVLFAMETCKKTIAEMQEDKAILHRPDAEQEYVNGFPV